jgi:uncharacterized membrane protein
MLKDRWVERHDEVNKRFSQLSEDALIYFHKSCVILAENQRRFRTPQNVNTVMIPLQDAVRGQII